MSGERGLAMDRGTVVCGRPRGLLRRAETVTVVENFSVEILPGECVGLVGDSGCGKSTIGRCLAGLQRLSGGAILLDGKPIETIPRKKIHRAVQMVFQSPSEALDPRQTARSAIAEPLAIHFPGMGSEWLEARVRQLLDSVQLGAEFLRRRPTELSGGQRQRVAIARALAVEPEYLICDEIVSALDSRARDGIVELLVELRRNYGLGTLFIGHDFAIVRRLCQRIISFA